MDATDKPPEAISGEPRILVNGVTWKKYVRLHELGVQGLKLAYCDGVLELMTTAAVNQVLPRRCGCYSCAMGAAAVWAGAEYAERFFMGVAEVQQAMRKLVARLDELEIPYAIVGAMALNEHGYRRVTVDVDVLLTREGLQRFKEHWLGRGYVEKFPGSRGVRDTELGVTINVLIAGDYPGDGQPKPVRFPDPATVAVREHGLALIPLAKLVELKLASGMSSIHRAKDIGDVVELIKHVRPSRELGEALDASVRAKYFELWDALQTPDPMPE